MPDYDLRVLSRVARLRPLPDSAVRLAERDAIAELRRQGLIRWDLGSHGWTITQTGLDALGAW